MPSMKLAEWSDGFVLNTDPRRDDPLYYYMPRDPWGSAIGIEVSPLYEEHNTREVSVQVWPSHVGRVTGMSAADRLQMYCRTVSTLLARFPQWTVVTLNASDLGDLIEHPSLAEVFAVAGFSQHPLLDSNQRRWAKA
jgi:hypothetical protein